MVQLLILIMGIALASYVVMAGISYFNADGVKAKEREAQWATLNLSLAQGWIDSQRLTRQPPSTPEALLASAHLHMGIPDGMTLTELGSGYAGWCFTGTAEKSDVDALVSLATRYPATYAIANDCGASNGISEDWNQGAAESGPQALAVTYRLNRP